MPRLLAFILSLGLFLTHIPNVRAEGSGIYVGGSAGLTLRSDTLLTSPTLGTQVMKFSPGYTFSGFAGYDFGNNFRLEGELSYRENEIRTGGGKDPQALTSSLMLNGYYSIPSKTSLSLYLGGGIGAATAQLETISLGVVIDADENVFAYQLETGVDWSFNPKVSFSLGYRFFDTAEPEFALSTGQRFKMDLANHEFVFKMRYLFNL